MKCLDCLTHKWPGCPGTCTLGKILKSSQLNENTHAKDIFIFVDSVTDIERVLKKVRDGKAHSLEILRQIDEIRLVISGRNYTGLRLLVERQLNLSRGALQSSNEYLATSNITHQNVVEYGPKFDIFERIFRNQQNKARSSNAISKNADEIIQRTSKYNPDVSKIEYAH